MTARERYVVLGLAPARSGWFRLVAQWANSGVLPVEFVKCISVDELGARLRTGRPFSALLADAAVAALDRDVVGMARDAGCAVVVVDDRRVPRDWPALGVDHVLTAAFAPGDLLDALTRHARPIGTHATLPDEPNDAHAGVGPPAWRGRLFAVTGPGGAGTSTAAIALAQGIVADVRQAGMVVLADCALHAEQAMLHDAGDVVPGMQELVEAHRHGRPRSDDVRALTFFVEARGYHLLLGLRRASHWPAVRPRAFAAALDGLRQAFRTVVADVDDDLEGEDAGGSADVEERHAMARLTATAADVVVAVGLPTVKGLHSLRRVLHDLREHGVPPERTLPVLNRAPRSPRQRAQLAAALAELVPVPTATATSACPSPVFLPERPVDAAVRDGVALPAPLPAVLARAVEAVMARAAPVDIHEPSPLRPGSLGHWADDEDDDDIDDDVAGGAVPS